MKVRDFCLLFCVRRGSPSGCHTVAGAAGKQTGRSTQSSALPLRVSVRRPSVLAVPHAAFHPEITSVLFKLTGRKSAVMEALLLAFIARAYAPTFASEVFTWRFHS